MFQFPVARTGLSLLQIISSPKQQDRIWVPPSVLFNWHRWFVPRIYLLSGRNGKLTILPYLEPTLRIGEDMHSSLRVHGMHRDSSHYLTMTHI